MAPEQGFFHDEAGHRSLRLTCCPICLMVFVEVA
jgi:hypothetical protein